MLDLGRFVLMEPIAFSRWCQAGATLPDVTAGPAADAAREGALKIVDGVAVIPVVGMLNKRMSSEFFELASYVRTSWAVQAAAADAKVHSILLKVDSPGGYVDGVADAADDIARAAKIKRVVAQVDGIGASAAYWLASQASEVYAGRLDSVGSIGVLAVLYDRSEQAKNEGIKPVVFSTGKYKWTGVPGTAITDEQKVYIQGEVDALGDAFVADVSRGRRRSEADVRKWADGRTWPAPQAASMGLIDGIRTYAETLAAMRTDAAGASARESRLRAVRLGAAEARARTV
jgi:signal peptide peptidase SppA